MRTIVLTLTRKTVAALMIVALIGASFTIYTQTAFAAPILDTHSEGTSSTCNTTKTGSVTISGSNPILIVFVAGTSGIGTASVTWGAASLTKANTITSGSSVNVSAWYLKAPGTGTKTLTITMQTSTTCNYSAVSFNNADQTVGVEASSTNNTIGTSDTGSVTTLTSGDIIADFITESTGKTNSLAPSLNSATKLASSTVSTAGFASSYTNTSLAPAGSYSITWTPTPSATLNFAQSMVAICPDTGCTGGGGGGSTPGPTNESNWFLLYSKAPLPRGVVFT